MKKLFTYLLISSMVVLSSCTNYDDQFDDLNSQLTTLKSQIEGFSSLSSGLTALQGTVSSLQAAVAALPKTATPATDISGLQTALTALAATVAELKTSLAGAATSAEVLALATSLATAQSDLSDLLAANNVYSTDLVINSSATLAFAKSLGDKLTIVNADVTFIVDDTMSAADVQMVADKLVTVTQDLTYYAKTSAVTAVDFSNLTSATNLTFVQAGNYNLGKLVSANNVNLGNNYSTKVTVVDLEALTTVGSLNTGSATTPTTSTVNFTEIDDTIDFSRATNIHLSALAVYTPGELTLKGAKDFTLKIEALTSQDADGEEVGLDLTVDGAASLNNDMLVSGDVNTTGVSTVILKKLTSADAGTVGDAVTLELGALVGDLVITGSDLETATIVSILDSEDEDDVLGGDITLSATSLISATISGVPAAISFSGASDLEEVTISGSASSITFNGNSSLTDVAITSAVTGAVTVNNSDNLIALDLAYTVAEGEDGTNGSLVITGNAKLASVKASKIDNLGTLTITGNEDLSSISFAGLADVNDDDADVTVTIGGAGAGDKNNLSASKVEDTVEAAGVTVNEGKITTASGITALKGYLDAAIAASGTVYVAFDTIDLIIAEDDTELSNVTAGANLVIINVSPNTADTGDDAIAEIKAYTINPANPLQISVGGSNFYTTAVTAGLNTTLAVAAIKSTEAMAVADAAGVTFNAAAGVGATTTVKFLTTASATLGEAYAGTAHSSTTVLATDDYVTLTINSQSVSSTAVTHASATSTIGIASALATAWMAKYGTGGTSATASLFNVDANATSGSIIVTAKAGSGNRGNAKLVSVLANTGTSTATTPIIDYVIGATRLSTDNKTIGTGIVLTFQNDVAGTIVPMPEIIVTNTGSGSLSTTEYFNKTTALNNANTASNIHPTEGRGIARNAEASNSAATSNASTIDYTSWL